MPSLKKARWANPNKMVVESAHSGFNRQTNAVSTGNVVSNTQYSSFVRAFNQTEMPQYATHYSPGHLQDFDLRRFREMGLPPRVEQFVREQARDHSVILYQFHHHTGRGRITHGYVVTDPQHRLLGHFVTGPTYKSESIIAEVLPYVAHAA